MRSQLLAASAICGAGLALLTTPAAAQSAGAAQASEIVVTGTHIPRPNLEQPTPVAVLTAEAIRNAGPQNLGEIIARLPAAGYRGTLRANANSLGNSAGLSSVDLRGLGLSRTLVLVDGQRHVGADVNTGAVDINSIPPDLVDRVEVITGGASAIYGSDAVSGVVNIITKRRFEGLAAEAQTGGYDNGFGMKSRASASAGRSFLGGRLNLVVSGFWSKEAGIDARDLPAAHNYGLIVNPADVAGMFDPSLKLLFGGPVPNDGTPDRLFVPNVGTEVTTRNGTLINSLSGALISFDAAGHVIATPARTGYASFGFGQLPAGCQSCFFPEDAKQVSSPLQTRGGALQGGFDFSAHLHGSFDLKFVQTDARNAIQPSISAGEFVLRPDNAFLTPEIRAALGGAPSQTFFVSRFVNAGRDQDLRRRTYRAVAGLDGDFDAGFAQVTWNGALNYGETDALIRDYGLRITENFAAALDSVIDPATGRPACRINVASAPQNGQGAGAINPAACVPYNPFGQLNGPAAMAYSFGAFDLSDRLTQQVATLNANFDTARFMSLQGGPIGVAAGAEYRMERSSERNDPLLAAGATENRAADSSGGFNVAEGYVELNLPVLRQAGPGLDELSFDAAYRGAHYSTVGGVSAYKVSAVYGPAGWIKFRGGYSRAVRAPNIDEAFQPTTPTFFSALQDPCSADNIGSNVHYAANCAAAGLPANFVATSGLSIPGSSSGNPGLRPERSFSYTAGVVLQPSVVPNLSVTLDYYSIKIKDAITEISAQDILNNCYGSSAGPDPTYCALFTRETARNNVNFIHSTFVNAAKLYTNGLELQAAYALEVAPLTRDLRYAQGLDGRLTLSLTVDYVMHLRNFPFQSDPSDVNVLEGTATTVVGANASSVVGNNPQVKGVLALDYRQGPVSVDWTARYVGRQALFDRDPSAADHSESLDIPFTEAVVYHDLAVALRLGGRAAGTEIFAGATNIFDEQPPFTVLGQGRDMSFDLGRFLFVGARYRR